MVEKKDEESRLPACLLPTPPHIHIHTQHTNTTYNHTHTTQGREIQKSESLEVLKPRFYMSLSCGILFVKIIKMVTIVKSLSNYKHFYVIYNAYYVS